MMLTPHAPQDMLALNAFDPTAGQTLEPDVLGMVEQRRQLFGAAIPLFYREPLHIVRGDGVWLFDDKGRRYLDAYNNVPSVGHCHPHVVAAIARQAGTLNTHARYLSEVVNTYAARLLETFPAPLSNVLFTSSGTESVDLAMRLARLYTAGSGFIVTRFAYHGHSTAVAEITPAFGPGVPLGQHVRTVAAPDSYRGSADVEAAFSAAVGEAIDDLKRHGIPLAGLIVDTVFSSDGLFTEPAGFLRSAAAQVRAAGGLLIADEVQPGFGRTGTGMWGFARHNVVPDIVVMGKPMGNGMPIAAAVTRPEVLAAFSARSGYFNTFGGNTVCCAAAAAVLDVLRDEQLIDNAASVGAYLKEGFRQLQQQFPVIGDVRGVGLYVAVEFVRDDAAHTPDRELALHIVNGLRHRGVLISTCGAGGHILKIRPPLTFDNTHCDLLLEGTRALLAALMPG